MSNKRYDDLIRALVPRQPQNPTGPAYGQYPQPQPQPGPGPGYYPGPYYRGQAPIVDPPGYYPPVYPQPDPWPPTPGPVMPVMPRPKPEKKGMSGLDLALVIFVAAMGIIFLAAALPN